MPDVDIIGMIGIPMFLIIVGIIALIIVRWVLSLRRIVPPGWADVVAGKNKVEIYSTDMTVVRNVDGTQRKEVKTVYYEWPNWIPVIGVFVRRMPLSIVEIPVKDYKTFGKGNARFIVDVSVYCRIISVLEAAQRFPGKTMDDFIQGIREIIVSAIRKTTANVAVEDVIVKRQEIALEIAAEIKDDFMKWGVELTNVAVVDIRDPDDKSTTVIHDISAKKEAEINSLSRQQVAQRNREAEIAEAEAYQASKSRRLEAEEAVGRREQDKFKNIATSEQTAVTEQLEVQRRQKVVGAEIDANARIKKSEGDRQSMMIVAEGERKKLILEGEGTAQATQMVGTAEAEVVRQKKFAEADGLFKLAEAQAKQQNQAVQIVQLQVTRDVYTALAAALQNADIKWIGSGAPKDLLGFFTPEGGLSAGSGIGAAIKGYETTTGGSIFDNPVVKGALDKLGVTKEQAIAFIKEPESGTMNPSPESGRVQEKRKKSSADEYHSTSE